MEQEAACRSGLNISALLPRCYFLANENESRVWESLSFSKLLSDMY